MSFGLPFAEMRCQPEDDPPGYVDTGNFEFGTENLEAALVAYVAPLAWDGYSQDEATQFNDYKTAERICLQLRPGADVEILMQRAYDEANSMRLKCSSARLSLANELRRLGALTYSDACRIAGFLPVD